MPEERIVLQPSVVRFFTLNRLHGFSTKAAGNMSLKWGVRDEVERRRAAFFGLLGINPKSVVHMSAEHGDSIVRVDRRDCGKEIHCDALVTDDPTVCLAMYPADCLPVFLVGEYSGALVHAGWRGIDTEIIAKTAEAIRAELAIHPRDLKVYLGPSIRSCCYANPELAAKLAKKPYWRPFIRPHREPDKEAKIDLVGHAIRQLNDAGLPPKNIVVAEQVCTVCARDVLEEPLFFSHERAGKNPRELEGRFCAALTLRETTGKY